MQTYTTKNKQLDLKKLINEQKDEPIILKNNSGNNFLLMPFSEDKKLEICKYIDKLEISKLTEMYNLLISNQAKKETDFWNSLTDWQKNDIELGLADLEQGNKTDFDKVMLKYQ